MANHAAVLMFRNRDTTAGAVPIETVASSSSSTGSPTTESAVRGGAAEVRGGATLARTGQVSTIQNLPNGQVLIHPLYVSIEQSGDEWFATSHDLAMIGRGESEFEAVDDLRAGVGELLESLREMRADLGPMMRDQLAFLETLAGGA